MWYTNLVEGREVLLYVPSFDVPLSSEEQLAVVKEDRKVLWGGLRQIEEQCGFV